MPLGDQLNYNFGNLEFEILCTACDIQKFFTCSVFVILRLNISGRRLKNIT